MKKLFALLAAAALVLAGTTPAKAGSAVLENYANDSAPISNRIDLSYSGSLIEGESYVVRASGSTCATGNGRVTLNQITSSTGSGVGLANQANTVQFYLSSSPRVAGVAGSTAIFVVYTWCEGVANPPRFRSTFLQLTFEAATVIGTPTNFSVLPQAGGTAFATWGIANGATSYTVTATPGGQTCTTTTNSCIISGLTSGSTYSFSVVGRLGNATGPAASLDLVLREPISVGAAVNFSVFPQAGGTAFATWGIANGATGYRVTATPGGATCTTADNFCIVSGLTPGETYNFSVVATNGPSTGPAVSSGPVVLREPVTVGVSLNGGNWRVGDTVTALYSIQGSNTTPTITWHRCDGPINPTPAPPAGACSPVGSGVSYVLAAGDVGKFITANVFVTNNDPFGQMTASSNNAVLASGAVAPAPVADPGGKPTVVSVPNPIVSVAGGTEVTITGTGLAGVTAVTIGGLPAIVVSKTDTTVVVQVPVSTKTGLADLTITNDKGSVTSKSAIIYTTNPVIKITKTRTITGFKAGQKVLTTAQKSAVRALITANPTLTTLSCAARTTGVRASKTELARTRTLATATCAYAKTLKKTLIVSSTSSQTLPKSKASRTVSLTLKN